MLLARNNIFKTGHPRSFKIFFHVLTKDSESWMDHQTMSLAEAKEGDDTLFHIMPSPKLQCISVGSERGKLGITNRIPQYYFPKV